KLFLMPVKDEGDPDYRQAEEVSKVPEKEQKPLPTEKLTTQTKTTNMQQVEKLIDLFKQKIKGDKEKQKERQTKFLEDLDKLLNKRGIEGTTEPVFDLISKNRFIEITGASGKGKSWLLSHCFKNLQGVKFTNMPTPQGLYTLNHDTLEIHISEIEKYNKLRTIEETAQRKKKQKFSEEQKKIKRYKLKTTPLTFSDLKELDKEDK
ncbi:17187_t:CDS:2, partial [Racocetra fulgida]